jgi:hypothetical protein
MEELWLPSCADLSATVLADISPVRQVCRRCRMQVPGKLG